MSDQITALDLGAGCNAPIAGNMQVQQHPACLFIPVAIKIQGNHPVLRTNDEAGRGGKDPARYGDWEVKGVAVDF